MAADPEIRNLKRRLYDGIFTYRQTYNFRWLGRPIIQSPDDVMAIQEIIWRVRPDAIIETGIAHGGSLILSASMLELIGGNGIVVGVDVDIREHNRAAIEAHPLSHRIRMIQGSSVDEAIVARVRDALGDRRRALVMLDSNHTHEHVLRELELYSPFVRKDSYLLVFDTVVEFMPKAPFEDRPWGPGDNPWTAAQSFLKANPRFQLDQAIDDKLVLTAAPGGWLKCVAD